MIERLPLAARMGRWSARHRRLAVLGWLAFVLATAVGGGAVGLATPEGYEGVGESGRGDAIVDEAFPDEATESVLVTAPAGATAADPRVRAAVRDVVAAVRAAPAARELRADRVSDDGRSRLVTFALPGGERATEAAVAPIVRAVERVGERHPGVFVGQFGDASAAAALSEVFEDDFRRAETISLPLTLLILVVAFGALVAAGIPLLLGLTAVAATLGLVSLVSQAVPMDDTVSSVVLLVGMAVGVDYTLFYLRREREERRRGRSERAALETAAATSGSAVLVSGLTVMTAMAGLFLAGDQTFTALGVGAILVVAVAMIGSVTVVPAVLAWLGDRVDRGRVPVLGRLAAGTREPRVWRFVLRGVLRRPAVALVLSAGVLVVLALPALGMRTALTGTDDLPRDLPVMQTYDRLQAAFPGGQLPAVVAVRAADVTAPAVRAAVARLEERVGPAPGLNGPVEITVSADRTVAVVSVPMAGTGADDASRAALAELRGELVPATFGRVAGVEAAVTGMAAGNEDFNDHLAARAPLVVGFVLAFAFVLLLVTFRSIVVPVKAIAMNLLSVAAALGVLTWVFQDGHLEGLLGFRSPGAVVSWLPVFLFVILFGLSMDYHVFILSRVREAWRGGMGTREAVAHGVTATAGTVTSAAVVMVAVFGVFATLSSVEFKMMGVGLATAILIDATIVRGVLLPAAMALLGERVWYLPPALRRPRGGRAATARAPA
jgi:RND superfamily putative drug exporter